MSNPTFQGDMQGIWHCTFIERMFNLRLLSHYSPVRRVWDLDFIWTLLLTTWFRGSGYASFFSLKLNNRTLPPWACVSRSPSNQAWTLRVALRPTTRTVGFPALISSMAWGCQLSFVQIHTWAKLASAPACFWSLDFDGPFAWKIHIALKAPNSAIVLCQENSFKSYF
jgi:hypothetical protein